MSSGLSSFAILRLNDLVELSCEGIKKKKQTNNKSQASNLQFLKGLLQSCQRCTTLGSMAWVCFAGCPTVLPSFAQQRRGARCLSFSFLKPSWAWGLCRQRSATCTLGEPKGSRGVPAVAWAQLSLLQGTRGEINTKKKKKGVNLYVG